jgi:hypothetical protein
MIPPAGRSEPIQSPGAIEPASATSASPTRVLLAPARPHGLAATALHRPANATTAAPSRERERGAAARPAHQAPLIDRSTSSLRTGPEEASTSEHQSGRRAGPGRSYITSINWPQDTPSFFQFCAYTSWPPLGLFDRSASRSARPLKASVKIRPLPFARTVQVEAFRRRLVLTPERGGKSPGRGGKRCGKDHSAPTGLCYDILF